MTNEQLEDFIEKYISVRTHVGKTEYDSKLVRQVMMAAAFYVREQQRKIDTDKACEWLKKNLTLDGEDNETIIEFRKAMEE